MKTTNHITGARARAWGQKTKATAMRAWVRARSQAARAGARIGHTIKAAISVRVRKVAKQRHLERAADALTIQQTAQAMARGLASKVESMGWRSVQPSELEDLAAIFRQHLAMVYNQCGFVPVFTRLGDSEGGRCEAWDTTGPRYEALQPYRDALKAAARAARSFLWGGGAESRKMVSEETILNMAGKITGNDRELGAVARLRLRHEYEDAQLSLAVYWAAKGGKQWAASLKRNLRLLGAVYQSKREGGIAGLLALGYGYDSSKPIRQQSRALGKAIHDLKACVIAGELLGEREPLKVSNTLGFLALVGWDVSVKPQAIERLQARLGIAPGAQARAISADGIADRVNRMHAIQRKQGAGLWSREIAPSDAGLTDEEIAGGQAARLTVGDGETVVPGWVAKRQQSRVEGRGVVKAWEGAGGVSAAIVRGRRATVRGYALRLIQPPAYAPAISSWADI